MAEPPKTPQTGRLYQSSIPDAITGAPNNGSYLPAMIFSSRWLMPA